MVDAEEYARRQERLKELAKEAADEEAARIREQKAREKGR